MSPNAVMSGGPPPPEVRGQGSAEVPPMPPSIMSAQGEQQGKAAGQSSLQKETIQLAQQKLLEFRNVVEALLNVMKAIDPESVAMFQPLIEVGKGLESRLQQVMQRAGAGQPSAANVPSSMPQQGQPQGMPEAA